MRERVLFGVGVTEAEVALARKIVEHLPVARSRSSCATADRRRPTTRSGSRAASRGARSSSSSRAATTASTTTCCATSSAARELVGTARPALERDARGGGRRDAGLPLQRSRRRRAALAGARRAVAAIIVEPVAPQLAGDPAGARGSSRACAGSAIATGALLIFDEVITGFRHHIGGYQAICGVTPDLTTLGKAIAQRLPAGRDRRAPATPGALQHESRRRRPLRRDLQRQRGRRGRGARDDRAARGRPRARARLRAGRADARRPARRSPREPASRRSSAASARSSSLCFMDGPLAATRTCCATTTSCSCATAAS